MREDGKVRLDVYNLLGERIVEVIDNDLAAGIHEIRIDGSKLASGIYIYAISVKSLQGKTNLRKYKKMILIK